MKKRYTALVQNAKKYLTAAILFEVFLVTVFILITLSQVSNRFLRFLFHLEMEFNIPALFSAAQLFLVGYGFLLVRKSLKQRDSEPPRLYLALGIIFIYLALDEGLFLHESITMLSRRVDWIPKTESGHGAWVLPYILIGLVFFLVNLKSLIRLLQQYTREFSTMAVGFFLYVLGALGLEINKGLFQALDLLPEHQRMLQVSIEEFLEMFGITIVLYGVLLLNRVVQNDPSFDDKVLE